MTPSDAYVFQCGLLIGAALMAHEQRQELGELDTRLQKVEREFKPRPRPRLRLAFAGWRDGERLFRVRRS